MAGTATQNLPTFFQKQFVFFIASAPCVGLVIKTEEGLTKDEIGHEGHVYLKILWRLGSDL